MDTYSWSSSGSAWGSDYSYDNYKKYQYLDLVPPISGYDGRRRVDFRRGAFIIHQCSYRIGYPCGNAELNKLWRESYYSMSRGFYKDRIPDDDCVTYYTMTRDRLGFYYGMVLDDDYYVPTPQQWFDKRREFYRNLRESKIEIQINIAKENLMKQGGTMPFGRNYCKIKGWFSNMSADEKDILQYGKKNSWT